MPGPLIEVADIIRDHANAIFGGALAWMTTARRRVLAQIVACRTSELGGHLSRCNKCDREEIAYNSCRNRHCPKCQGSARAEWVERRVDDLLPVKYFHVVFTVPPLIAAIAMQNKKVVYSILFKATAETLKQIAADPRHLGARIGFLGVLHTWGQTLNHHPHIHCVVPGGGLSPDRSRWIPCKGDFFLPSLVLAKVFRGKFLEFLKTAHAAGELNFQGALQRLQHPRDFAAYLEPAYTKNWVVYAKRPFGGPEQVLKYLAQYTHRVAISNHRILAHKNGEVTFRYRDYRASGKQRQKTMALAAVEFLRRFALHVLPTGFNRIRYYGFMSNAARRSALSLIRALLNAAPPAMNDTDPDEEIAEPRACPACGVGSMIYIGMLNACELAARDPPHRPPAIDSS